MHPLAGNPVPARRTLSILLAFGLVMVFGCRPNESIEGQARDAKIKTQIKSKLASDVGATTVTSIQVNVTNGVVTLSGAVHSQDEKSRAEASARAVEGVVSVTNSLQILTDSPPSASTTTVPGPTPTPIGG